MSRRKYLSGLKEYFNGPIDRHEEALRIILWNLKSFTKAEVYCDRVAEKTARKWANDPREASFSSHNAEDLYGNVYSLFVKVRSPGF